MEAVHARLQSLLCAPTGFSPVGLYRRLAAAHLERALFANLNVVKLDEWVGVPQYEPATCEHFLRQHLLGPLGIPAERYMGFDSMAPNPEAECARIDGELRNRGGADICVLGLGRNGHVGFNEPGPDAHSASHVAVLSEQTRTHPMIAKRHMRPTHGMTLGIGAILQSRKILMLVTGQGKEDALAGLLAGNVTTSLPATFILLHPNVEVLIDDASVAAAT